MLAVVVLLPALAGVGLWVSHTRSRVALGIGAVATLTVTLAAALWVAQTQPVLSLRWGSGLDLRLEVAAVARPVLVLVPFVALPIVGYAAAHEDQRGLARMIGLLVTFVGAMQLLLLAGDTSAAAVQSNFRIDTNLAFVDCGVIVDEPVR